MRKNVFKVKQDMTLERDFLITLDTLLHIFCFRMIRSRSAVDTNMKFISCSGVYTDKKFISCSGVNTDKKFIYCSGVDC